MMCGHIATTCSGTLPHPTPGGLLGFHQAAVAGRNSLKRVLQLATNGTSVRDAPAAPRSRIGDAEMGFQRRPIVQERRAVSRMHDGATIDDHGAVGDAENLLGILLDQDRRDRKSTRLN